MIKVSTKKAWLGLISISIGFALVYIDQTALNVALPTIKNSFNASETELFWFVNAYLLPLAICSLGAGKLGDLIGLRTTFLWGMAIFILSSIGCALAFNSWFFILFRVFQGIGGSVIPVTTSASVFHTFPEGKRGKPMGLVGFTASATILIGPIIGGLFTKYGSWRWIFWINPIIGILSFVCVYFLLKFLDHERKKGKYDFVGQFLFLGFLVPIIFALMQGEVWGWSSVTILTLLAIGILFFPIFMMYEKQKDHPIFDLTLLKNKNFAVACILCFCIQFAFIANVFTALYLIRSLENNPFQAGLALIPGAVMAAITNPIAGSLTEKIGYRKQIQVGLIGAIIGYSWIAFFAHTLHYPWLLVGMMINGFSLPVAFMAVYAMVIHSAPKHQQGMASGIVMTLRQVGASFSLAFIGIIITAFSQNRLLKQTDAQNYAAAFSNGMILVVLFLALSFISTFWIKTKKAHHEEDIAERI